MRLFSSWRLATALWIGLGSTLLCGAEPSSEQALRIAIDATDLPRKLLRAELTIPISPLARGDSKTVRLWYPKWVPGSHGPGGPVANLAGFEVRTAAGESLEWSRAPGEVYRFEVEVPADVSVLRASLRYIASQPTTTSFGHDCFGSSNLGVISPAALLLYPDGTDIDEQVCEATLRLPEGWQVGTALTPRAEPTKPGERGFQPVSLRNYVDSPMMCGRYYRTYELTEEAYRSKIPAHTLHVFADDAEATELNSEVVDKFRAMVTQTGLLIGSHPFARFEILLGVSDVLPKNGLEHSRSTFNVLPTKPLQSTRALKGWDRLLIPHEYLHAWCGKYRRPSGMLTPDFHTAKDTELLWVYEGLTQYLGELVEARCGLMSADEFRHRLLVELRNATHQQGRQWRSLADTAAASHILRAKSPSWSGLRRSQDYYMEGMLFWLEADARIRAASAGKRSLDDFCEQFFRAEQPADRPRAFDREEIVQLLNSLHEFDWDGLISRRIESRQQGFDPSVAELLGYQFQLTPEQPKIPANTFRHSSGVDALDSLGLVATEEGTVQRLLLGSPADLARLAPADQILGIDGKKWSGPRLNAAVKRKSSIELLVSRGNEIRTIEIQYYDGLKFWNLKRDESKPDQLAAILKAKS